MPLTIEKKPTTAVLTATEREAILADPGFGRSFTDHMVTATWTKGRGWHDGRLVPFGPFPLHPAANVLHYAQEIFEGMKAYRLPDGAIATFRPEMNARRFQHSARRMAMPELPVPDFIEACESLLRQDHDWVPPHGSEKSLYLRPFMIGTEAGLGMRPADEYLFSVIASPAGPYFAGDVRPVSIWLCEDRVRAVAGGVGDAKTGGNYAASLLAQTEAAAHGCDQVAYLDAVEHRWVEELGAMNLFFVYQGSAHRPYTLVTPPLSGSLLAGVTRDSVLTLARELGWETLETPVSVDQWQADATAGSLTEVFACGTAAVLTPVGNVKRAGAEWTQGDGAPGRATLRLRRLLLDVQRGIATDRHGWVRRVVR